MNHDAPNPLMSIAVWLDDEFAKIRNTKQRQFSEYSRIMDESATFLTVICRYIHIPPKTLKELLYDRTGSDRYIAEVKKELEWLAGEPMRNLKRNLR